MATRLFICAGNCALKLTRDSQTACGTDSDLPPILALCSSAAPYPCLPLPLLCPVALAIQLLLLLPFAHGECALNERLIGSVFTRCQGRWGERYGVDG